MLQQFARKHLVPLLYPYVYRYLCILKISTIKNITSSNQPTITTTYKHPNNLYRRVQPKPDDNTGACRHLPRAAALREEPEHEEPEPLKETGRHDRTS